MSGRGARFFAGAANCAHGSASGSAFLSGTRSPVRDAQPGPGLRIEPQAPSDGGERREVGRGRRHVRDGFFRLHQPRPELAMSDQHCRVQTRQHASIAESLLNATVFFQRFGLHPVWRFGQWTGSDSVIASRSVAVFPVGALKVVFG